MPRGQTPTPAEKAQAELDKAQADLAKIEDRLAKKKKTRDEVAERLDVLADELVALNTERDEAKALATFLAQHPLLGGQGAPAAPAYAPLAEAPPAFGDVVEQHVADVQAAASTLSGAISSGPYDPFDDVADQALAVANDGVVNTRTGEIREITPQQSGRLANPNAPVTEPATGTPGYAGTPREQRGRPLAAVPQIEADDEGASEPEPTDEPEGDLPFTL